MSEPICLKPQHGEPTSDLKERGLEAMKRAHQLLQADKVAEAAQCLREAARLLTGKE
jgi:hypothetical protein